MIRRMRKLLIVATTILSLVLGMNLASAAPVDLTPPELVDDVVAVLRGAGTTVRKRRRGIMVDHDAADTEEERGLELVFFLRAWRLTHPELAFELVGSNGEKR